MRSKLTKQIVATAKPSERETIIWDSDVRGLGLRVTPKGAKSFILKTRIGGGRTAPTRKPTLGKVGELTLDQARAKAREWKVMASNGTDPARHKVESGRTIADLCAEYLEVHAPRKRSGGDDKAKIAGYVLPRFGRRLVKDITFSDIERFHRSMKKTPIAANRTMALLSKMFALAIQWEWTDRNPTKGIERYPEERRERFLSPDEIQRLSAALVQHVATAARPNEAKKIADAIRLLLLTGARRSEVLSAQWCMFDLTTGVWTKPSSHTKQKKEHRVPLSPPAHQLLAEIRDQGDDSDYVFPARRGSKHPHITELKSTWVRLCHFAELENIRVHDLRHTYASVLVSGGDSLPLIGALLGHTQAQTTHRYAHLMDDPLSKRPGRIEDQ